MHIKKVKFSGNLSKIQDLKVLLTIEKTKGTIIFNINIVKLVNNYPKIMTSSITLNFFKSYYEDIENICKENQENFNEAEVI